VTPESSTVEEAPFRPSEVRRLRRSEPAERAVDRKSTAGAVVGRVVLDPSLFGIEPNQAVLHQVVTAQLAAARSGTQSTKTRAEVRGGGAKPFRQKGTGRARQGSTRSPQWVGGGVALGPKPRSYAQHTPKKMVQLALRSALSDRAAQGRVAVIDQWTFDAPSTKQAIAVLEAVGVSGNVLVVLGDEDGYAERSFANLPEVQTLLTGELNVYDILVNDWILFTDGTLPGEATETAVIEGESTGDTGSADDTTDSGKAGSEQTAEASDSTEVDGTADGEAAEEEAGS
jgi:large subunit ribosomal protein L4